jgi:hypothetical protein
MKVKKLGKTLGNKDIEGVREQFTEENDEEKDKRK